MHHRAFFLTPLLALALVCLSSQTTIGVVASAEATARLQSQQPVAPQPVAPQPVVSDAQIESTAQSKLSALLADADRVVRGTVISVESSWNESTRQIESVATVAVTHTFVGQGVHTIKVHTQGGYLPEMGLGMVSMHAAQFETGEDLLLLLQQAGNRWQTVQGAAGKVQLNRENAINVDQQWQLQQWDLWRALANPEMHDSSMALWNMVNALNSVEDAHAPAMIQMASSPHAESNATHATHRKWPAPHATATFYLNLNSRQIAQGRISAAAIHNAIVGAADTWSRVNSADFRLQYGGTTTATTTSYNGVNEIMFMSKGDDNRAAAAEVWYTADMTIVEADIWINDDYLWDTSGNPATNAVDLESALLHEFGHWLILDHNAEENSIMYPRLTSGDVRRQLYIDDVVGISVIYPR